MLIQTRLGGHLDAPIDMAFGLTRDFSSLPMWHNLVVAVREITGPTDEVGSTAIVTIKTPEGPRDFRCEVTQAEAGRLSVQAGHQIDGPMSFTSSIRYTPSETGCDWEWEQDNEMPDNLPFGNQDFLQRLMTQMLRQSAENYGLLLEAIALQPA